MSQTHFQVLGCSEHDRGPAFKELLSSHVVAMVTQALGAIIHDPMHEETEVEFAELVQVFSASKYCYSKSQLEGPLERVLIVV